MLVRMFACPSCGEVSPRDLANRMMPGRCPSCRATSRLHVFPTLFRPSQAGKRAESAALDGDSTCFYHPGKRAAVICDGCGAFLCALCDMPAGDGHVCPRCLERGRAPETSDAPIPAHTRYDQIAASLGLFALLGIGMCFPALILGPLAIGLGLKSLLANRGPIPYTRWGAALGIAAGGLASLIGFGYLLLFVGMFYME